VANYATIEQQCEDWFAENGDPIVESVYRKNFAAARAAMDKALAALPTSGLAPESRESLKYHLAYLQWQIDKLEVQRGTMVPAPDQLLKRAVSVFAESIRNQLLMQIRIIHDRDGSRPFTPDEFHDSFRRVMAFHQSCEFWHYVATWAFLNQHADLVAEAMGNLTVNADGYLSDYLWQRANLMHQILKRTVTPRDIREYLKLLQVDLHVNDCRMVIWPVLQERGLVDDALEQEFAELAARIHEQEPKPPGRERSTRGIRN
jgi:hypothetical protein